MPNNHVMNKKNFALHDYFTLPTFPNANFAGITCYTCPKGAETNAKCNREAMNVL